MIRSRLNESIEFEVGWPIGIEITEELSHRALRSAVNKPYLRVTTGCCLTFDCSSPASSSLAVLLPKWALIAL